MKKLKINRFLQDPAHCAVASCSVVANYYNEAISYDVGKKIAYAKVSKRIPDEGLSSGNMGSLLNYLGFNKVTIISSNLNVFDWSWSRYGKNKLINCLDEAKKKRRGGDYKCDIKDFHKWLGQKKYDNNIVMSYDFGKYIRQFLDEGKPVVATFNWHMFFKFAKENLKGKVDPINGTYDEHAIVVYGYNKKGVFICDSHHQYYKYKWKRYRKGFYKMSWENLMSVMSFGDVFLPEQYEEREI